jgi:hypothetical protein
VNWTAAPGAACPPRRHVAGDQDLPYMGWAEWFRHETIAPPRPGHSHGRQQLRPREDWIPVPVPAIISEETFEAAQRVKRDNSVFSPRRTTAGLGSCAGWSCAAAAA